MNPSVPRKADSRRWPVTFAPPAHHPKSAGRRARLAAGAPPVLLGRTVELEALHANALHVPIGLSLSRWFRDGQPYFTAVIWDITERR